MATGSQGSQGPANENKRTCNAGDRHGSSWGGEEAVGTGRVLEGAQFDLREVGKGSVLGRMSTFFRD